MGDMPQTGLGLEEMKAQPELVVEQSTTAKLSYERDALEDFQLAALKLRFETLHDAIPMVRKFAAEQGISEIRTLEDGARLLFPHTLYKSYPLSVLENGRFDKLTTWLNTLTAEDLSGLDASKCEAIDDWIDLLDQNTPIRVRHSSGTTGKLSFVPGHLHETRTTAFGLVGGTQGFGDEPDAGVEGAGAWPLIVFTHRLGGQGATRHGHAVIDTFHDGKEDRVVWLDAGRLSADLMSLGGRLEGARAKGELGKTKLSPALLARREAFMAEQGDREGRLRAFIEKLTAFKGQNVMMLGNLHIALPAVAEGLALGHHKMFGAGSVGILPGGTKGKQMPDNFEEKWEDFMGFRIPRQAYGMSEATSSLSRMCPEGKYHLPPNIIPYLLDPQSGELLPREGVQTGRLGVFDVSAQKRWGGFLSSDKVTLHWDGGCRCGRKAVFIDETIGRYTDSEGGDDKINCAGVTDVHNRALDFIAQAVGQ